MNLAFKLPRIYRAMFLVRYFIVIELIMFDYDFPGKNTVNLSIEEKSYGSLFCQVYNVNGPWFYLMNCNRRLTMEFWKGSV